MVFDDSHYDLLDAILDEIEAENDIGYTTREGFPCGVTKYADDENVIPWILQYVECSNAHQQEEQYGRVAFSVPKQLM